MTNISFYINQKSQLILVTLHVRVAGTNTHLHLIKPLGFRTDDKMLKRAGLDYWNLNITYHDSIEAFLKPQRVLLINKIW